VYFKHNLNEFLIFKF